MVALSVAASGGLFPAYAGVILTLVLSALSVSTFPRLRGGDPSSESSSWEPVNFSPPTRG